MRPRAWLQWGPKELEELRAQIAHLKGVVEARDEALDSVGELVADLKQAIQGTPCLAARPGEATYECRHDSPCRVCQWRQEVNRCLVEEWHIPNGIW